MRNANYIILICLLTVLIHPPASATEFQYAQFTEISYTQKNGDSGLLLSFVTDPGRPITVLSDDGDFTTMKNRTYDKFFEQLNIGKTSSGDPIRALNVFGRNGWEVISVTEQNETIFTDRLPAKRIVFLMKKIVRQ